FEAFLDTEKWFRISYGEERLKGIVTSVASAETATKTGATEAASSTARSAWWDPPTGYSQTSLMLGGGITLTHRYEFIEDGDGTLPSIGLTASGPMSDDRSRESRTTARSRPSSGSCGRGSTKAR